MLGVCQRGCAPRSRTICIKTNLVRSVGVGREGGLVFLYNYCRDGCCENSLITDFIVMININRIICTVTDGHVWVPVGLSLCVYAC